LDRARPGELSLLASARYLPYFQHTSASAVLLDQAYRHLKGGPATRIVVDDPRTAVQRLLTEMYPPEAPHWGVHPKAYLGRSVRWSGRLALGPDAILEDGVVLGEDCVIGAGSVIGRRSRLGHRCHVESGATLGPETILGNDVLIRAGARIGGIGFGYVPDEGRSKRAGHVGHCVLEDGVEVGANTTIDRGSVGDTLIAAGTKIDNLVHIGHNVRIGQRCYIMAQVGVAGSTDVGDDVILAGQAGLADHLSVGSRSRVAAQSGVIGNLPPESTVSGYPARPHREVLRQVAALRRLTPLIGRLEQLALEPPHGR
jgi:UDP-3-O-[3-hydroxymyristoyl] glucosamine N-acyltransferase